MSKPIATSCEPNVFDPSCSARHVLELIANKWSILIIYALNEGPTRNGALLRKIPDISQKMLTQTIRDLERNGLVARKDYSTLPLKVEYSLTECGLSLAKSLAHLDLWAKENFHYLDKARARYENHRSQNLLEPICHAAQSDAS